MGGRCSLNLDARRTRPADGRSSTPSHPHRRFVGIEFAVTRADPPDMFVIEKRDRTSPTEGETT